PIRSPVRARSPAGVPLDDARTKLVAQKNAIMRLLVYPALYVVLWVPALVNRLAEATGAGEETRAGTAFAMFTVQLIGVANALAYGAGLWIRGAAA
ncbi:hypothetical protein HDU96_008595, partial [Phlyctochytrium bullatum]